MHILFYGNCQMFAVLQTIRFPKSFQLNLVECWKENIDKEWFTNLIQTADVIITQPIQDNYKNVEHLSTTYILQHKQPQCKLILFDSCYFNFYYFDLTYKFFQDKLLQTPSDYHYNHMMQHYIDNKSPDTYIDNVVNNIDLKSTEELLTIAQDSLNELARRHTENIHKYGNNPNIYIISTHDYIEVNYKHKLLFYSMNHPTKFVIQYICEQIVNYLQLPNTINYTIDVLSNYRGILYQCLSKCVTFDINACSPLTEKLDNVHAITKLYYDAYAAVNFC